MVPSDEYFETKISPLPAFVSPSKSPTVFPVINKKYRLEKGDALFFDTLNNYECMTKKAIHGGAPVKSGEKWVCNLWVHKYTYTGPEKPPEK